jgi:mono/diheme cytochrome c family protein
MMAAVHDSHLSAAGAAVALALLLAGCGGAPQRPPDGRRLFIDTGCGACHTLTDARTHGAIGPNFDTSERLNRPQLLQGMVEGANGMPSYARRLSPARRGAIADYLLRVAWRRR